jgi:hypothetical protein
MATRTDVRLLSILVGLIAAGCSGCSGVLVMFAQDAPERDFQVAELLIDETALPTRGWAITDGDSRSPCVEGPGEEAWVSIYPQNATSNSLRVVESICQYDKTRRASLQYDRLETLYIFPFSEPGSTPPAGFDTWEAPPMELSFASQYADKWRLACHRDEQTGYWYRCRYFALYSEYLLEFGVYNGAQPTVDSLSYNEIVSILRLIDDKMAIYLGSR